MKRRDFLGALAALGAARMVKAEPPKAEPLPPLYPLGEPAPINTSGFAQVGYVSDGPWFTVTDGMVTETSHLVDGHLVTVPWSYTAG